MLKNKTVSRLFLTVFCCFAFVNLGYAESCSSSGQVQYKPSGSCGTSQRTCCTATGAWSDWGGSCPSCSSSQCWNGSKCEDKEAVSRSCSGNVANASGGTQTRTATCTKGSGWSYGSWSGTCTCASGYTWSGSSCNRNNPPSITVYNCQTVPDKEDESKTWVGAAPSSAPSAAMYAVINVTGTFVAADGSLYTSSGTVTLDFPSGSTSGRSKEFILGVPSECSNACSYHACTATFGSSGWR